MKNENEKEKTKTYSSHQNMQQYSTDKTRNLTKNGKDHENKENQQ